MFDYSKLEKYRWIDRKRFWKTVKEITEKYYPKLEMPVDVELIAEKMNLEIIPVSFFFKNCGTEALYLHYKGKDAIIVDRERYLDDDYFFNRNRFSMAHELGHYVFHRDIYREFEITIESYIPFILNMPEKYGDAFEWHADEFAGKLLVPKTELLRNIPVAIKELEEENLVPAYIDKNDELYKHILARKICKIFEVSAKVVEIRLNVERLWPLGWILE